MDPIASESTEGPIFDVFDYLMYYTTVTAWIFSHSPLILEVVEAAYAGIYTFVYYIFLLSHLRGYWSLDEVLVGYY